MVQFPEEYCVSACKNKLFMYKTNLIVIIGSLKIGAKRKKRMQNKKENNKHKNNIKLYEDEIYHLYSDINDVYYSGIVITNSNLHVKNWITYAFKTCEIEVRSTF